MPKHNSPKALKESWNERESNGVEVLQRELKHLIHTLRSHVDHVLKCKEQGRGEWLLAVFHVQTLISLPTFRTFRSLKSSVTESESMTLPRALLRSHSLFLRMAVAANIVAKDPFYCDNTIEKINSIVQLE